MLVEVIGQVYTLGRLLPVVERDLWRAKLMLRQGTAHYFLLIYNKNGNLTYSKSSLSPKIDISLFSYE